MTAINRHLYGDTKPILVQSPGAVGIEAGDFVYRETNQSNQAYPFSEMKAATGPTELKYHLHSNFLGVAMESKESGVTENITIATEGVFRFPLAGVPGGSAVTIGARVSAVSPAVSGGGVSNQAVSHLVADGTFGSTAILGIIQKTESGASFVDIRIHTSVGAGILTA